MSKLAILSIFGDIELDVSLNEEHNIPAKITRNPVEDGSQYGDNIVLLPIVLNFTARVSDASIIPFSSFFGERSIDVYNRIVEIQSAKLIVEIATGVRVYQNMFIENITVPREAKDGKSLRFEIKTSELLITGENAETNRDAISEDVLPTALPVNAIGTVQKVAL